MTTKSPAIEGQKVGAIVIGAGIAGVKQLYELRSRGIDAHILDAAGGVGGTWYWNRYPGCRFDVESYTYGYFFSRELLEEWTWTEEFATQKEIERYVNFVVDKFELRPFIHLNTRVDAATWDEGSSLWRINTASGSEIHAEYFVTALGILSAPRYPDVEGLEKFDGEHYHTGLWPHEEVSFKDKHVAVVGTGSSGVQIVPIVAEDAASVTVFQRSPNWCTPLNNKPIKTTRMNEIRSRYDEISETVNNTTASGFIHLGRSGSILDLPPEERTEFLEGIYNESGMTMLYRNYEDVTTDPEANDVVNEFLAEKIRSRVNDPETAEKLIPRNHGFGAKRPPQETNYYETFNKESVSLVSMFDEPIVSYNADGLSTTEKAYEFDMIIFASGFDAVTGSYSKIDIRGLDGIKLMDVWEKGPLTYFGLAVPGFPNMLIAGGPQSTRGNISRFVEAQTEWIGECLETAYENGWVIEATQQAAEEWSAHVAGQAGEPVNLGEGVHSWFLQQENTEDGKPVFLVGTEGLPVYRKTIAQAAANQYRGFAITAAVR